MGCHDRHHHGSAEKACPQTGNHRRHTVHPHQRDENAHEKDVDHRPGADDFGQMINARAVAQAGNRTALHGNQQKGQRDNLADRHDKAGKQHQQAERPGTVVNQVHDTGKDGIRLAHAQPRDGHHRIEVGRNQQQGRRRQQGPGAVEAGCGLQSPQRRGATRAT